MELAIPLVALGSLYIVSNQNEAKPKKEGFRSSGLPNVNVPDVNYDKNKSDYSADYAIGQAPSGKHYGDPMGEPTSQLSTLNRYDGPSAYTDKYFGQSSRSESAMAANPATYTSLSGQQVDSSYYSHNNMMPFFGSKIRSTVDPKNNEAIMDNYLGTGTTYITKTEQAPLYSPNEKIQYPYGAPNMNDFYQSRINTSLRMDGVKPFQPQQVGPGLGLGADQLAGEGGYNSGMASRDSWRPKTVDELRTANRQKATDMLMLGHEGPGKSRVTNVGILGTFQKNRPETAFEWGPDRYFTTTGVGKAQTAQAIQIERHVNRPDTTVEYNGVASSSNPLPIDPGTILPSHREENGPTQFGVANANGRGYANDADYGIKSNQVYMNNRAYNSAEDDSGYFGAVKSGIGAVIAPILEVMRPSRKENVTGNMRVYGDAKTAVTQGYLYNPNDAPAHTMRETTEESINHLNVNRGQVNNGYLSTPYQTVQQHRDTTTQSYIGGAGYHNQALRPYDAELSYVPSDIKASTINHRFGNSNTNMFNNHVNYHGKPKDNDQVMNRDLIPRMPSQLAGMAEFGRVTNQTQQFAQVDRNTPDLYNVLQQNPYAIKRTYAAS